MFEKLVIQAFVAIVEFVVAFIVYYRASTQSKIRWWLVAILLILHVFFALLCSLVVRIFFVDIIICAIMYLALSFAFDIDMTTRSRAYVLVAVIAMTAVVIIGVILAVVFDYELKMSELDEDTIFVITFVCKLLLLLFMQILGVLMSEDKSKGKFWYSFAYLALPLATLVVLFIQSHLLELDIDAYYKLLIVLSAAILTFSNIIGLAFIERSANKEKQLQLELFRRKELEKERAYYENTIAMATQSNKTMHDLKHLVFNLSEQGEMDNQTKALIAKMAGIAKQTSVVKYTSLSGLNVLFNSKFNEISKKQIEFEHHIIMGEKINIDEIDLCILFGNLLDNAIEGVKNAPKKFIKLMVAERKEYLTINMTNSTTNKSAKNKITSKKNKLQHGFGLQSICDIADKYDGDVSYDIKNGVFEMAIMLKNNCK